LLFLYSSLHHLHFLSFPTRRSSDLSSIVLSVVNASCSASLRRSTSSRRDLSASAFSSASLTILSMSSSERLELDSMVIFCSLPRSEEHTSELQSRFDLVCRLLLEKK